MRNRIIILLVFILPLSIFAFLQFIGKENQAVASSKIAKDGMPHLIKFYSPMCSECKEVAKNLEVVKDEYDGKVVFEEINVNDNDAETKNYISLYKVTVVPTIIFQDKAGVVVNKTEGMIEENDIRNYLDIIK